MDHYPTDTLPFPIRPGDDVHFVVDLDDGPAIETYRVCAVGVNDQKRILVFCEDEPNYDYELGIEERCFLTAEDAQRFIADEGAFTLSYGTTDLWPEDMPFRPGEFCFTADDEPGEKYHIFDVNIYSVVFRGDGTVIVSDDMSCESCVVGPHLDPCFLTFEEAHEWYYEHRKARHRR
jgi:hypothetical protein